MSGGRTVAFHTLGCKVNAYDTQAMRERFEQAGYEVVGFDERADVYVINTCTVTGVGDKKSMQAIRRCHRLNPQASIVVCGCLAQRAGEDMRMPGVRLVLGTQRRGEVVALLERAIAQDSTIIAVETLKNAPFERLAIHENEGRTRATMKIQEGCDRYCSYCIIPYVRGPVRSRPLGEIHAEAVRLANAGYAEIVLTGIHLTSYGRDFHDGTTLLDAIGEVHAVKGVHRVRLSSLEPVIVTKQFISGIAQLERVCHHFHLALQSGSDVVLTRMRRRYTSAEFLQACAMLQEAFDDCTLTTDVMTGFPGETEDEFEQTMDTCRKAGFARMHVFPYSEREGTLAATMPGSVPREVREARARRLIALGHDMAQEALLSRVGREEEVLIETVDERGFGEGYTGGYQRARVPGAMPAQCLRVRVIGVEGNVLLTQRID